jgi:hypothetical protein
MADQAPALPWAHATAPSRIRTDADTATGQLCGARLEEVGLAADCLQIEVLWTVHRHKEVAEDGADAVRHEEEVEHKVLLLLCSGWGLQSWFACRVYARGKYVHASHAMLAVVAGYYHDGAEI